MSAKKGHRKHKSASEETEDLLFSDVDIHKLKPGAKHKEAAKEEEKAEAKEKPLLKKNEAKKLQKEKEAEHHNEGHGKEIKINFNPDKLKRAGMIALFLFLAVSFFYNPFYDMFPWNEGVTGNMVQQVAIENPTVEETPTETEAKEEEKKQELPVAEPGEDGLVDVIAKPLSKEDVEGGKITIEIIDFRTASKEWGAKVTEVDFVVENTKIDFMPKIEGAVYDRRTMAAYRKPSMAVKEVYDVLKVGKRLKGTIDLSKFQFTKENFKYEKTISLELKDEGETTHYNDDTDIATASKKFSFPSS